MERFNTRQPLTSTEAATLLKVHPSTVKRWCNEGLLDSETTDGGHRRIHLGSAVGFARAQGIDTVLTPFHPYEPHVWTALQSAEQSGSFQQLHTLAFGWVLSGDTRRLEQLYLALGRSAVIDFCTFCDEAIRGLMHRVGQAWAEGRLRVGEEHLLTQVMIDVLHRLRTEWIADVHDPYANGAARLAIVGTLEGNHHHLGALCIRILLERLGWRVLYLGPDVPVDDFGTLQKGRGAHLTCISLGPGQSMGDVRRCMTVLGSMYDRALPYGLVFGGAPETTSTEDSLGGPFECVHMLSSCADLSERIGPSSPRTSELR